MQLCNLFLISDRRAQKKRIQEQWDWKFLVLTHYTLLQLASFRRLLKVTRLCRNCLQSSIETVEGKLVAHIGGTGESTPSAEQNDILLDSNLNKHALKNEE